MTRGRAARFILATLLTMVVALVGCNTYVDKTKGAAQDIGPVSKEQFKNFSFDFVFSAVIAPRCLECHSTEKKNRPDLTTYAKVMRFVKPDDPLNSDLYLSLQEVAGDMPRDRAALGPNQRALVKLWIASGAPAAAGLGHVPADVPDVPMPPVRQVDVDPTYTSLNKNVFVPFCVKCHQPHPDKNKGPAGGLDLTTYDKAIASRAEDDDSQIIVPSKPEDSSFYDVMKKNQMPKPKTAARLSSNVAEAIFIWIKNGAKND